MDVRTPPLVLGDRSLPPGYPHPHASEEARRIAERGTVLRGQVGSGVHGTAVSGQDDRDEMGLCLEPPEFVTGLARVPEPERAYLRSVRRGEVPLAEVLAAVGDADQRLVSLQGSPAVRRSRTPPGSTAGCTAPTCRTGRRAMGAARQQVLSTAGPGSVG